MKKILIAFVVVLMAAAAAWLWLRRAPGRAAEEDESSAVTPTAVLRLGAPGGQPFARGVPIALSLALEPTPSWAAGPDRSWPGRVVKRLSFGTATEPWWTSVELRVSGAGGGRSLSFEIVPDESPGAVSLALGEAGYVTLWLPAGHALETGPLELIASGTWRDRQLTSDPLALDIGAGASRISTAVSIARHELAVGKHDKALAAIEPAVAEWPKSPILHDLHGQALESAGQLSEAVLAYKRAIALALAADAKRIEPPSVYYGHLERVRARLAGDAREP